MPKRIQLRRTKGWRKPEGTVVVSRPSRWGNPFRPHETYRFTYRDGHIGMGIAGGQDSVVRLFEAFLDARPDLQQAVREELAGHDLACWCRLDEPCHADVLLSFANGGTGRG
jgi:hypothetical protein